MSEPPRPLVDLTPEELSTLTRSTVSHYQQHAEDFREGTKDHDVSQNVQALLRHLRDLPSNASSISAVAPAAILPRSSNAVTCPWGSMVRLLS